MNFACHILFEIILNCPFKLYPANSQSTENTDIPTIFYTQKPPLQKNAIHIIPQGIMDETGIRSINPGISWRQNIPLLFPSKEAKTLGFDIFSASFFMATRYEEYLPFTPDAWGRFPEIISTSGKNDFTHLPVVHLWADLLAKKIKENYKDFLPVKSKATALFTYDIDVAYAFRGRSLMKHILSLGKDLLTGKTANSKLKFRSRFGLKNDPSDVYNYLINNNLKSLFFFLLAKNPSKNDHNLSPDSPLLQRLIRFISSNGKEVGIHPSFRSGELTELIAEEKQTLEKILNRQIDQGRQHFLRFRFPDTFRSLLKAGIRKDYSLQYPEMPGFRAGMCLPFPFFDLAENRQTELILYPGCIMETTFRDDLHLPAFQSFEWYLEMWEQVQHAGGLFISIWHNDTLWEGLPDNNPLAFRQIHDKIIKVIQADTENSGSVSETDYNAS